MENVYLVIVIMLAGILSILFAVFKQKKINKKSSYIKKSEIIEKYKNRLEDELSTVSDSNELNEKRVKILKEINLELSKNIFFEKSEIPTIIKELAAHKI